MHEHEQSNARRIGIWAGALVVGLQAFYLVALALGLMALPSPGVAIQDPYFTVMVLLILAMMPAMVLFMVALHAMALTERRVYAMAALVFTAIVACLTSAVHFTVLVFGRSELSSEWQNLLQFQWPSVVYVLDVLAWDVFFALAAVFAALVFRGSGLGRWIRILMLGSGALAAFGLVGAVTGDMQIRNIGIVGYAGLFPVAVGLAVLRFARGGDP